MKVQANHFGPLPFRAANKPPVAGGRWKVRRLYGDKPWRAWTHGRASRFNRRFGTHREAILHASLVAQMFADPTPARIEMTIRAILPHLGELSIQRNVVRYARFPETKKQKEERTRS